MSTQLNVFGEELVPCSYDPSQVMTETVAANWMNTITAAMSFAPK